MAAATTRLVGLLAFHGLRVSEAIGADIERLGLERGQRTLSILRKGGKMVTVPLAPRTARAVDLAAVSAATDRSSAALPALDSIATPPGGSCGVWLVEPGSTSGSDLTRCGTTLDEQHRTAGATILLVSGNLRGRKRRMGNPAIGVPYVLAMVAVVVGVDLLFFRDKAWTWERLVANVGIVLLFGRLLPVSR